MPAFRVVLALRRDRRSVPELSAGCGGAWMYHAAQTGPNARSVPLTVSVTHGVLTACIQGGAQPGLLTWEQPPRVSLGQSISWFAAPLLQAVCAVRLVAAGCPSFCSMLSCCWSADAAQICMSCPGPYGRSCMAPSWSAQLHHVRLHSSACCQQCQFRRWRRRLGVRWPCLQTRAGVLPDLFEWPNDIATCCPAGIQRDAATGTAKPKTAADRWRCCCWRRMSRQPQPGPPLVR